MAKDPKIKVDIVTGYDDKGVKGAQKGMKDLEGSSTGLVDKLGGVGTIAAAGGAAMVAAAVKGVMAYEDLGLKIGKLHDATGIAEEDASRLVEVFGDMGVSSEDLGKAIGKMEKTLGANEAAFEKYDVKVAKTKDGQVDANQTFLNAIDALNKIQDPLKRNAAGAEIFGKSWANMAEAINKDGDQLRKDLAAVDDSKVFDEKKVGQARELRDAFDKITDAGQDLFLTLGHALAPVITKLAPTIAKVVEAAGPAAEAIGSVLAGALEVIGPLIEALLPIISTLAKGLKLVGDTINAVFGESEHKKALQGLIDKMGELTEKAKEAGVGEDELASIMRDAGGDIAATAKILDEKLKAKTVETDRETRKLTGAMGEQETAAADAATAAEALATAHADLKRDSDQARASLDLTNITIERMLGTLDAEDAVTNFGNVMKIMTDKISTGATLANDDIRSILTAVQDVQNAHPGINVDTALKKISDGDIAGAWWDIQTQLNKLGALTFESQIKSPVTGKVRWQASGGTSPGGVTVIGEDGPEIVDLPAGARVTNARETRQLLATGTTGAYVDRSVTNVYYPPGVTPETLRRAQRRQQRRGLV